jgi:hypothetical protein
MDRRESLAAVARATFKWSRRRSGIAKYGGTNTPFRKNLGVHCESFLEYGTP